MQILDEIVRFLVLNLGYATTVHLKDSLLFLAGIFIGQVLMALLTGNLFYKLNKVDHLKNVTSVKLIHEGKPHYFVNPRNFPEAVEVLLVLSIMHVFSKKDYTVQNEKRTQRFLIITLVLGVLVTILGVSFIYYTILPDGF